VHIVLIGTRPNSVPLIALGYCYSTKRTLFFVFHSDTGSTHPGKPYKIKYTDDHGNVCVCLVDCPDVVSCFFADSNLVDKHNQVRQDELGLKKCWVTSDPYFRLTTTICSIHVVDCWKLAVYHKLIMQDEMGISKFTGILGFQLIKLANSLNTLDDGIQVLPLVVTAASRSTNTSSISGFSYSFICWC